MLPPVAYFCSITAEKRHNSIATHPSFSRQINSQPIDTLIIKNIINTMTIKV